MPLPPSVRMVEVGPRDGLQNEPGIVPAPIKAELIDRLAAAGLKTVEAAASSRPSWYPKLPIPPRSWP